MGGCGDGGCDKGGEKELIEAVLTCEGNISDPDLPLKLSHLVHHLKVITESDDNWLVRKVEPWNSVRVTFSIPKEAALRLHQLAQAGDAALQQLGILSVQVEGDQIVSLKVAGPNNETTEILIRTVNEGAGPSGENVSHASVATRPHVQALGGTSILPSSFNHQHHQPHPVPQFRSPSAVIGTDAVSVVVGRLPVVHQRPQVQPYSQTYSGINASPQLHPRHMQQLQLQPLHLQSQAPQPQPQSQTPQPPTQISSNSGLHHSMAGSPSPSSSAVVARPAFPPTNPPPPYPREEVRPLHLQQVQQVANLSQTNGQPYVANQTINNVNNSVISNTPTTPQSHTQINSVVQQSVTVNYRLTPSSQVSAANNSPVVTPSRVPPGRTQVNMVKNSPLLVGLLQQPDQTSVTGVRNIKNNIPSSSPNVCVSSNSISVENGPLPTNLSSLPSPNSNTLTSTGTYIGRSRDGLTTHQQIYSGGSVITNSPIAPPPPPPQRQHLTTGGFHQQQQQPQSICMPISASGTRVQHVEEQRRPIGTPPISLGVSNKVGSSQIVHIQGSSHESCGPTNTSLLNTKLMTVGDGSGETAVPSHASKKESQYLINPNTGLLEPRPTTDSSDSETEGQTISSTHDDHRLSSVVSDDESNLSNASRKEIDHSDSDMSRISSCVESRKFIRGKSRDKDSSPISSWENNVGSNPGEKIKLRLKLGKEQVAQATIVGTAKINENREITSSSGCNTLPSISEPRVPKLHIKLHSSQPVIVKTAEEMECSNRLSTNKDLGKEKAKRSRSRSKLKACNSDLEPFKSKNFRLKANREKLVGEDVTSQVLKILDPKRAKSDSEYDNSLVMKYRESPDMRLKVPRLQELSKPSTKMDNSKLRTRLKKPNMRKVGDLNSVGEITSHKILETLPPSITKVAAMHTQHPHRNPSSTSPSSPVPLSSITPSLFSSFSLSSNISPNTSNDQLKAELEKRGSEIIPKSEVRIEGENDILMTKVRLHPSIMNGDIPHNDKLSLNSMRYKRPSPSSLPSAPGEFASSSKLTIKRQRSDEMHTIDTLKKEGLSSVPTFLNSSVLINKVQSEKNLSSNVAGNQRQSEDFSEKFLNKVGGEITGLKSNSDITIHSLSKKDSLRGLNKGSEIDRSPNLTMKPKAEITKVGRVTCVDVMDRKALEEALKSSRNSSKKSEVIFSTKSTSSMVDRLRRWNSIDSSSASVPFSSHSQQQAGESTNLSSLGVRVEPKEPAKNDSEKQSLGLSNTMIRNNNSVAQQANTVNNVHIKSNCDNSGNDSVDSLLDRKVDDETKVIETSKLESLNEDCKGSDISSVNKVVDKGVPSSSETKMSPIVNHIQCLLPSTSLPTKSNENDLCKISDLINPASILKAEVDSPEGTPKGEHGNGQGGEDSGIESMDALSEKSPNHSDQSPNRREEKECEIFSRDKIKERSPIPINSKVIENKLLMQEENVQDAIESNESKQYFVSQNDPKGLETHSSFHEENSENKSVHQEVNLESTKSHINCDLVAFQSCTENLIQSENVDHSTITENEISDVAASHMEGNALNCEPQMKESKEQSECLNEIFDDSDCNSSVSQTNKFESDSLTGGKSFCDAKEPIASSFPNSTTRDSLEPEPTNLTNTHFNDSSGVQNFSQEKSKETPAEVYKPEFEADTDSNGDKIKPQSKSILQNVAQENLEINKTSTNSPTNVAIASEIPNDAFLEDLSADTKIKESSEEVPTSQYEMEDFQLLESTLDSELMDISKINFSEHSLPLTTIESSAVDVLSAVCSATISIPTTSICVTSPKCNLTVSPSVSTHCSPVSTSTTCSENFMQLETITKDDLSLTNNLINSKPSVVAITLSRPTGGLMAAQFAPSMPNSIVEKVSPVSLLTKSGNALTSVSQSAITTGNKHFQHRIEGTGSSSIVFCHSISCNNNSLAYSNSYSTNTTSTNATMIILSASSSNSGSVLNSPCNSTKVVTLKPGGISQSTNSSSLNPPVGKTFRLVALPGINSMNPAASPVKGQLVTLKPVVGTGVTTTISKVKPQLLQTIPVMKSEESDNSSLLKTNLSSPLMSPVDSSGIMRPDSAEGQLEDLDFVGFCNSASNNEATSKLEPQEDPDQSNHVEVTQPISFIGSSNFQMVSAEILSPTEEEPKPMRVHPPLYTYGNRERKKEIESDAEEKEKEDNKDSSMPTSQLPPPQADKLLECEKEEDNKLNDPNIQSKFKDKNLDALTIEIPNNEHFPEDKRLTRSARQNARLSSPKINSPGGELSPRNDKRSVPSSQVMCKPSPLGVLRSSISPALRGTKRRRHESESSSTSTLSEDLQETTPKVSRRKQNDKIISENKEDCSKSKAVTSCEFPKDVSSDEESIGDEELYKKHTQLTPASLTNDEDDENSKPKKNGTRSRDKSVEEFKIRSSRDTTPTRRTPRQNRIAIPSTTSTGVISLSTSATTTTVSNQQSNLTDKDNSLPSDSLIFEQSTPNSPIVAILEESSTPNIKITSPSTPRIGGEKECEKKMLEKKFVSTSGPKEVVIKALVKGKRELENELDTLSGRRKTRSTTSNTGEDSVKRRKIGKDNKP